MFGWCVTTNTCIIRFSRFHWRRRSVASTVELFGRQVRARPKVCSDRSPMMMMLGCVLVERTLFWVPTVRLAREEMAGPAQWKCFAKWISIVVICFVRFFFSENVLCVDASCSFQVRKVSGGRLRNFSMFEDALCREMAFLTAGCRNMWIYRKVKKFCSVRSPVHESGVFYRAFAVEIEWPSSEH